MTALYAATPADQPMVGLQDVSQGHPMRWAQLYRLVYAVVIGLQRRLPLRQPLPVKRILTAAVRGSVMKDGHLRSLTEAKYSTHYLSYLL